MHTDSGDRTTHTTACVICAANCGLLVDVEANKVARVRADPGNPISRGHICHKAMTIGHIVESADRLAGPLRRRPDGTFEAVSWDDALDDIALRLGRLRAEHGPRSLGIVGLGGQANHLEQGTAEMLMAAYGSDLVFNAWAQEKTQNQLVDSWMFGAPPELFLEPDVAHADVVVLLGCNPRMSHVVLADEMRRVERDPQRRLVVIDPRRTESAREADIHLALEPGTDVALLSALAAVVVQEKLLDRAWLRRHARDTADVVAHFRGLDVHELAVACDVPEPDLRAAARLMAQGPATAIRPALGVEHHEHATVIAWLVRVISAFTGDLGKRGGLTFHASLLPTLSRLQRRRPHHTPVTGLEGVPAFGMRAAFSPVVVPDEILSDHPDRLRALIVEGSNPARSYPGSQRWAQALDALDLLVVIDPCFTETARHAHYVLPCPVGYEKWEASFFPRHWPEVHAQLRPPILEPPPGARPESEIHGDLATRLGLVATPPRALRRLARRRPHLLFPALLAWAMARERSLPSATAQVVFTAGPLLDGKLPAGLSPLAWALCNSYALLQRGDARRAGIATGLRSPWAIGSELLGRLLAHPEGAVIGRRDAGFVLPRRARLDVGGMRAELDTILGSAPRRDPAFPFLLSAGNRGRWTANTVQRDPRWRGRGPHGALGMNPDDAAGLGLADGDTALVTTDSGATEVVVCCDAGLRRGHVTLPNVFGLEYPGEDGALRASGPNVNVLAAGTARDRFVGNPANKHVPCQVAPARTSNRPAAAESLRSGSHPAPAPA